MKLSLLVIAVAISTLMITKVVGRHRELHAKRLGHSVLGGSDLPAVPRPRDGWAFMTAGALEIAATLEPRS